MRLRSVTHWLRPVVLGLLILLCARPGRAYAQYQITTWTTEQGLPQSTVHNIAQTPDGFLWIATAGGLARFDGATFRIYDTTSNPELPTSRIAFLMVDDAGTLWLGTHERQLIRFADERFSVMGAANGLPSPPVIRYSLFHGKVLAVTEAAALIWKDGRFVADPSIQELKIGRGMQFIGTDHRGVQWYRDQAGLVHRFELGKPDQTIPLPGSGGVYEDTAGRVWGRDDVRLFCVDHGVLRTYSTKDGFPPLPMMGALEDPDGTIWWFTHSGIVRLRGGRFRAFTTADGLPDNQIRAVFRDREGSHWIGTDKGLSRMIERPIAALTKEDGLEGDNIYALLQDRRGDIWIGGWPGLTRYRNGVFEPMSQKVGLPSRLHTAFMEDRDGALWIGMWGQGLKRVTFDATGVPSRAETPPGWDRLIVVTSIYQGRGPDIWIGTEGGAFRYHDGVYTNVNVVAGRPLGFANVFHEDASGTVWIGFDQGLARYANGVLTPIGEADGFAGTRVRAIYEDRAGTMWIGTYDRGVFRYRDGKFTRYTTHEGLPTNGAFHFVEDSQSRLWITSNVGIYRVMKSELDEMAAGRLRRLTAVLYGREDGMGSQETNGLGHPSVITAQDGRLWFSTQRGVSVIDPASLSLNMAPPPVAFLDINVGGYSTPEREHIDIRSGSTSFQAKYTALTFVRPELAQFRYRMEGLDLDWVDAGADRTARYARLPFGTFRFRVMAANRDGIWNEHGAAITIVVVPPFWRTTWFMSLAFLAFVAAGFGTHRVRLGVIEKERARQEAFARQLIDSQETDRKRIASDLHDGVSQTLVVIRNWAQIGEPSLPEDSAGRKRMGDIGRAAAQALGEVREVVQDLVPYHLERMGLAQAVREAAERVADASGIAITCRLDEVGDRLKADVALRLFRVVQEGLNNIVKHSAATSASLELVLEPTQVRVRIQDNGKGFVPASVTPSVAGDGFGLVGMTERAKMMGGEMTIDSAPGKGTTITITVPATT